MIESIKVNIVNFLALVGAWTLEDIEILKESITWIISTLVLVTALVYNYHKIQLTRLERKNKSKSDASQ